MLVLQPGAVSARVLGDYGPSGEYVVVYATGASLTSAHAAVAAAGGTVVKENLAVGLATVLSSNPNFLRDAWQRPALAGVARNRPIGRQTPVVEPPGGASRPPTTAGEAKPAKPGTVAEPLADLQWDMAMIHATPKDSYSKQLGKRGVLVGVIDTGIDGTHPDIAPNFDAGLSRNFVTDIPEVDGPCEHPSCVDPVDEDGNGHGTHVAGTIAAAVNGLGIAGVAPNVTLVNLRAGQDSGYFFLDGTVDALVYAGDAGIDVVNMSFFVDPWLFNCLDNPADSPVEQQEQRVIRIATQRALTYAHDRGVTLISAEGNEHANLDDPTGDTISPDFLASSARSRSIDHLCQVMPTMGNHVIGVTSVGPSTQKADYSDYSSSPSTVSAPGGYSSDFFGTPRQGMAETMILSAYPEALAKAQGQLASDGSPIDPRVVRDCQGGTCAYYQYAEGTSMAAPHATGVAALIVSRYGKQAPGSAAGQLTMDPDAVAARLRSSATDHACPVPALVSYAEVGRPSDFDALCVGTTRSNNFYGDGIVNALAAVTGKNP